MTTSCGPYNESPGARGAGDTTCPSNWQVIKATQNLPELITVTVNDVAIERFPVIEDGLDLYCSEESTSTSGSSSVEAQGFPFRDECLSEGAILRFREYWNSNEIWLAHGKRISTSEFQFDFTDKLVGKPGLFLADLVLYQPNDDYIQAPVFVKPFYLEFETNSMTIEQGALTISELRMIIRDECSASNYLLDDLEYTDKEIFSAMRRCVDYWNEVPPNVQYYSYSTFPFRFHWATGTMGLLLRQAGMHKLRNFLDYTAAGVANTDSNRWGNYQKLGDQYWNEFREFCMSKKVEFNIDGGFRSV